MNYVICVKRAKNGETWQPHIIGLVGTIASTPQIIRCPHCTKTNIKGILKKPLTEKTTTGHYIVYQHSKNAEVLQQIFHTLAVLSSAKATNEKGAETLLKVLEK